MKRIFAVIVLCCLLFTGCGQSKTAKPIYELPDLHWGASIEQAEQVYGEMTEVTEAYMDFGGYARRDYTVSGEYEGYAVSYQFRFYVYEGRSYLVRIWIDADTDRMSEKEQLAFCNLLEEQFEDIDIVDMLGEWNPEYSVPTTDDLSAEQDELYRKNCQALGTGRVSNMPLVRITLSTLYVSVDAEHWTLANVDLSVK